MQKLLITLTIAAIISCHNVVTLRKTMPHFTALAVLNEEIITVDSRNYKGKYKVIMFYPLDFTCVCGTDIITFSDAIDRFRSLDTEVFGVSTDSHFSHLAWTKMDRNQDGVGRLAYPLIADFSKDISRDYGLLVENEEDELHAASHRGLFIIDRDDIVRHIYVNDAPVGISVDEIIRLIQAFQYTDQNGVVCPANWKPGASTIIPDQKKKMEYFNNEF